MAFQITQMSFDIKQGTGIVSLMEPPEPPRNQSINVTVFFPLKLKPTADSPEQAIERGIKEEAKRLLRAAADAL